MTYMAGGGGGEVILFAWLWRIACKNLYVAQPLAISTTFYEISQNDVKKYLGSKLLSNIRAGKKELK